MFEVRGKSYERKLVYVRQDCSGKEGEKDGDDLRGHKEEGLSEIVNDTGRKPEFRYEHMSNYLDPGPLTRLTV